MPFEPEIASAIRPYDERSADRLVKVMNSFLRIEKFQCMQTPDYLWNSNLGDSLRRFELGDGSEGLESAHAAIVEFMLNQLKLRESATPTILSAKINEPDSFGMPILHRLLTIGQWGSVPLLLANGADPGIRTTPGENGTGNLTASDILGTGPSIFRREIKDLFDLATLAQHRATEYFVITTRSWTEAGMKISQAAPSVKELQQMQIAWPSMASSLTDCSTFIHVPSTNGLTLLAIFRAIQNKSKAENVFPDWFDAVDAFYDGFQSPPNQPGDPLLNYRKTFYKPDYKDDPSGFRYTTIVFPCLALSTVSQQQASRERYSKLRALLSTKTSGRRSTDCTVHFERTLDEAYYPGLDDVALKDRNNDQVVSRKFENAKSEPVPLLMVPQLWLWRVGGIIVSAYSMKPSIASEDVFSQGRNGSMIEPQRSYFDPDEQLGAIIAGQIIQFGQVNNLDGVEFPSPLDIFEISVISVLTEVNVYMETTKPSEVDHIRERKFLHILSDIRSELGMIQYILEQQEDILNRLLNDRPGAQEPANDYSTIALAIDRLMTERLKERLPAAAAAPPAEVPTQATTPFPSWGRVEEAQKTLAEYQRRAKKIDGDVDRIEKMVQDKLDLKRAYASIKNAHSSLLLSAAVIGFTVITVIFAPLAFLTALFALKIEGFSLLQLKGPDGVYSSWKMGVIFLSSEALTITLTVAVVALSFWYLNRTDLVREGAATQKPMGKDEGGKKSQKQEMERKHDRKDDLESQ